MFQNYNNVLKCEKIQDKKNAFLNEEVEKNIKYSYFYTLQYELYKP